MRSAIGAVFLLAGCGYVGTAQTVDSDPAEEGWVLVRGVEGVEQWSRTDCGPAALVSVLRYYGQPALLDDFVRASDSAQDGARAGALRDIARGLGYRAHVVQGTFDDLEEHLSKGRPLVVGLLKPYSNGAWPHYEVVVGIHPELGDLLTHDPARGWTRNTRDGFLAEWEPAGRLLLVIAPPATTLPRK